jgi:hypothetical protein
MSNESIITSVNEQTDKLHIDNGQYVVPRSRGEWVYDVLVKDNTGKDVCTVGFTKNQTEGALFFNNLDDNYKYYHEQDNIKRMAKEYALSHGVRW